MLTLFAVCAIADWFAVARGSKPLEYAAKPATLAALMAYAATGDAASGWLIAALAFSLLGDILLMLPANLFVGGLASFLLAHAAYIAAFQASWASRAAWLAVVVVLAAPLAARILRAVGDRALRSAVGAYILVISLMVASAVASGSSPAAAGAVLFFVSDAAIAWNRFVRPFPWAQVAIHVTYHLGQLGIVAALRGG